MEEMIILQHSVTNMKTKSKYVYAPIKLNVYFQMSNLIIEKQNGDYQKIRLSTNVKIHFKRFLALRNEITLELISNFVSI